MESILVNQEEDPPSITEEVKMLEAKLASLNLETQNEPDAGGLTGVSLAVVQNDIRTSLKSIEFCIQKDQEKYSSDVEKLQCILTKPLKSSQRDASSISTGNDLSNIISYLKLLSEVCPPVQSPSGERIPDVFWRRVLEPIAPEILTYLNDQIFRKCFMTMSSSTAKGSGESGLEVSSQGTGFAFHHQLGILLKGVRVLLVYLKRATINLPNDGASETLKKAVTENLAILSSLMDPLKSANNKVDFDIGLDVRCNIGVGICYSMLYLCYPDDKHVRDFFNTIFASSPTQIPSSSWSNNEQMILQLGASDANRIALAFGILNTWLEKEYDENLYFSIAKNVLNIEHGVKETINLGSARVLEIWTEKLARPCIPINVLKHVAPLFVQLELFCFMYMPAHIDAVKNCCRNILSSLSQIYDRLDEEKFPVVGHDSKKLSWVAALISTVMDKLPHIKWIALSCVVKNTKKSLVSLELDPKLPENLLTTPRTCRTAANDTYVALMSYHFEQKPSEAYWGKYWISPLFSAQPYQPNESNWTQKKNIVSIILNSEKMRVSQFQGMIVPLLKNVVQRMNKSEDPSSGNAEVNLTLVECSLLAAETIKMAYELKITIDPKELNLDTVRDFKSAPEDSFRGLVPRSVLNNWLWNENSQIRLAGFALLVETKKTSDIISKQDFDSLKIFLKYNLLSQNPAFRQQFSAYFKKLVRRLRDGESYLRRKRDLETIKDYEEFLRWLWHFLAEDEGLFHGANFARRCQSLECLSELSQTFPNGFELFGLTGSGNTKYLRWLTDSYENNKMEALEILCRMPIEEFDNNAFCSSLFDEAMALCKSVKPPDSVTGRYLMTLLMRKCSDNQKYSSLNVLELLFSELEILFKKVESSSLVQVSCETPLYGCVRCIRMVLGNTTEYREAEKSLKYREYVAKLLKLCFAIDDILFPVLGSAAPEGWLPGLKDSAPDENKQVVRSLAAQMLLVCAWRTMKEICLLMSDMCYWFVMEGESNIPSLKKNPVVTSSVNHILTFDQVSAIGDHLLYLLKNLMHRGVFEQVFVGFKQLSTRLWKSTASKLSNLPERWLQHAMDQEHISAKSITRRSAGLPFIFQALLSAESDNEQFLQKWVERLLIFDEAPDMAPIRIHSMNVLRGLFRDATFSSAMMPFVPHGLKMAFRGLKSADWTERNSGLMLYGAVMRRTFGPKLNLMNAPTFFRKFPQMYDFLLIELDTCIQLIEKRRREQETLRRNEVQSKEKPDAVLLTCDFTFHLLLLLSSFTSCGRVEDTHFKLAEFIPRIRKCGESDDMEVRKLTAKAIIPFLVSPEDKFELAKLVLSELSNDKTVSQNQFHGLLFQFLTIIRHLPNDNSNGVVTDIVSGFLSALSPKLPMFSKAAPTIFETILEILVHLNELKSVQEAPQFMKVLQLTEKGFEERFGNYPSRRNIIPGLHVADKTVANCALKIYAKELEAERFFEKVYGYFTDTSFKSKPYTDQLLELVQDDAAMRSKFIHNLFYATEITTEAVVIVEAVISNYLKRVTNEFSKFPGTEIELRYLIFLEMVPANLFESLESDIMLGLSQRLFQVCNEENGKESTTLQMKAAAFLVLGQVAFSTGIQILSPESTTRLCDIVLHWSASDVDDDMRSAVARSFPSIPFSNLKRFDVINQAKVWSSILTLAQDDESSLREIINCKLTDPCGNVCCDRKSLEILVQIYVREFLVKNPIEGMLVIIGLLLREDFEVEAKAADDETEDRLFDKSEMNMYFEHQTLAKTIKAEMESSNLSNNQLIKACLDVHLAEEQVTFYHVLANKIVDITEASKGLSIRRIVQESVDSNNVLVTNDNANHDAVVESDLNELTRSSSNVVKRYISKFVQDIFNSIST